MSEGSTSSGGRREGLSRVVRGLVWLALVAGTVILLGWNPERAETAVAPAIRMPPEVRWSPGRPGEGTLFRVTVAASVHTPVMGARGAMAGEELHFRRVDDRTLESFAAVPVGSTAQVTGTVRVAYESGGEEEIPLTIPVTAGVYHHERLTVAPRFGSPPSPEDEARLARDRDRARVVAAVAHRTPLIGSPQIVMPRDSRVTSGFGDGREFNGQISSRHLGLDLRGARGDTVVAAARGVVALVDDFLLAGNIVYLNHGAGLVTGYFHLSRQLVSEGDTVEAGAPIGLVGATGRVTGPHLHWVARYGSTSVDPRSFVEVRARPE